jgi:ABC-type phosphate/phosphonate transport system substrate-binding protein
VAGENLVVLLDREQTASLASLPFAKEVEIVARSKVLPSSILCLVSGRLAKDDAARVEHALLEMHQNPGGVATLKEMRLKRFVQYEKRQ